MQPFASFLTYAAISSSFVSAEGFFESFEHIHFSKLGTPYVHAFGIEPAFTGRDLFLDYSYLEGDGVTENETELELEWAFTSRLGLIMEVPYIWEDEDGEDSASGFGDSAIVPRVLLVESDRFLLTAQVGVVLPTGSSFGGDTAIAPGIAVWNDLGNWFTLNSGVAFEHSFDEDSTGLVFGCGLVKSFGEKHEHHAGHEQHASSSAGLFSIHLEATGSTLLNGSDKGDTTLEGLVGISYGFADGFDIRAGYLFPITSPKEFDHGFTTGVIFHF